MNSRVHFEGAVYEIVYETGEYTFETRPDCLMLPDGRVLLIGYKPGCDHIESVMLAKVAQTTTVDTLRRNDKE